MPKYQYISITGAAWNQGTKSHLQSKGHSNSEDDFFVLESSNLNPSELWQSQLSSYIVMPIQRHRIVQ